MQRKRAWIFRMMEEYVGAEAAICDWIQPWEGGLARRKACAWCYTRWFLSKKDKLEACVGYRL